MTSVVAGVFAALFCYTVANDCHPKTFALLVIILLDAVDLLVLVLYFVKEATSILSRFIVLMSCAELLSLYYAGTFCGLSFEVISCKTPSLEEEFFAGLK